MRVIVKVSGFGGPKALGGLEWLIRQELLSLRGDGFPVAEDDILVEFPASYKQCHTSIIEVFGSPGIEWPTPIGHDPVRVPILEKVGNAVQLFRWNYPATCFLQRPPSSPLFLELPSLPDDGATLYPISADKCGRVACQMPSFVCFEKRLCPECGWRSD